MQNRAGIVTSFKSFLFYFQCGGTLLKILIKDMPESLAILWSHKYNYNINCCSLKRNLSQKVRSKYYLKHQNTRC